MQNKGNKTLLIAVVLLAAAIAGTVAQIRQNLVPCYRGNETEPWIGNTKQLLLELLRKIEDANPTSLDIRTLSVHLFHRLRVDGIQKSPGVSETANVTPYGTNGIMTPKFSLLLQLISNIPGDMDFSNFLTPSEVCNLHRLLSSTVEPFERGDEARTCPMSLTSDARVGTPWITMNKVSNASNVGGLLTVSRPVSRCPIERGVIRTNNYGTLAPGVFVASVAAGLQPQNVRLSEFISAYSKTNPYEHLETMERRDTKRFLEKLFNSMDSMDNAYAAGLAGDLAEVCVYQGPMLGRNVSIGVSAAWNDTAFPRINLFAQNHRGRWEMTDSEILTGIDGLFLSQQVFSWVDRIRRLRLSQLFDMYYSQRGIPLTSIENARRNTFQIGNRRKNQHQEEKPNENREDLDENPEHKKKFFNDRSNAKMRNIFDNPELEIYDKKKPTLSRLSAVDGVSSACNRREILAAIDREKLKEETFNLAQVLQFTTSSPVVSSDAMREICDASVDRFFEYATILLDTLTPCKEIPSIRIYPSVDLTLIIDGSRREYESLQLISYITELIEVSSYGSNISVIHGGSGQYLVNNSNSVNSVFDQLRNFTGSYPTSMSLSRSLASVVHQLANQTVQEQSSDFTAGTSQVVLIVSQTQRITQTDFDSAQRMIQGSLLQFPDLYFIFLTNDVESFTDLLNFNGTTLQREAARMLQNHLNEHYYIIDSNSMDINDFSQAIEDVVRNIPKRLVAPFCRNTSGRKTWEDVMARSEFEEYLSPGQEIRYRISPYFLRMTDEIAVQFQGVDYGDFTVCMSRDKFYVPVECKQVEGLNEGWFNVTEPCSSSDNCSGIYFAVTLDSSNIRCTESDCRFPDQVRYIIRHHGLRCEIDGRAAGNRLYNEKSYFILTAFSFIYTYFYLK